MLKKEEKLKKVLGWHYIIEAYSGDSKLLNDEDHIRKALISAANAAKTTIIDVETHKFSPHGITAVLLLAESHISIHTWPEHNYAAIDVFVCGGEPEKAIEDLKKSLNLKNVKIKNLDRGLF